MFYFKMPLDTGNLQRSAAESPSWRLYFYSFLVTTLSNCTWKIQFSPNSYPETLFNGFAQSNFGNKVSIHLWVNCCLSDKSHQSIGHNVTSFLPLEHSSTPVYFYLFPGSSILLTSYEYFLAWHAARVLCHVTKGLLYRACMSHSLA